MEKLRLAEVFSTVGLPRYTYVKPRHFGEVRADIEQPGKHLLIEGPSGIGKTCVVYKVFEELQCEFSASVHDLNKGRLVC
jgi:Cdc6-like AAA superfamily ATPase